MYSTLTVLKAFVLPKELRSRPDADELLQAIGSGLAERFDTVCNRKLLRAVDDMVTFSAEHDHYILPRYPIETVSTVETRSNYSDGWSEYTNAIDQVKEASGIVSFDGVLGVPKDQIRVTWTGGYWVDLTGSDALPEGAAAMPADLMLAWKQQVKHVYDTADKDGDSFRDAARGMGGAFPSFMEIDLLPGVVATLKKYTRYQIL